MNKNRRFILTFLLPMLFLMGLFFGTNNAKSKSILSVIRENLTIFGEIYKAIPDRYVDEVDSERLFQAAINGMLSTLDPYTTYIEQEDQHDLQIITQGNYGGVGLLLSNRNGMVTVGDPPFLNTPAARAGIREGDIIIKVDDTLTSQIGFDETARSVRGPAGTEVTLTIIREGEGKELVFTLIREKITIDDVDYSGILNNDIGYIRLIRFSKNAGSEVSRAIEELKTKNMKGLILDLRSNPGGLLDAAVDVSDLFLPQNLTIVSTRGRANNSIHTFQSERKPQYGEGPLVVLVDQYSASASEIVAGAIQDHDRGIVVGDTTFGKGLVQSVITLQGTNALLKITTAKYYTPSGRCIQTSNYSEWDRADTTVDNLIYQTDSGRSVQGGGGIAPDIIIEPLLLNDLLLDLQRKSLPFNFAVHYASTHSVTDSNFQVTNAIFQEFIDYLREKEYDYRHPLESSLNIFRNEAVQNGYGNVLIEDINRFQQSLNRSKEDMITNNSENIRKLLSQELSTKLFGKEKGVEINLQDDPAVQKAFDLINNTALYASILRQSG
ncbi:S41 family peptidase [bacterium]|nr:S41 family peptidase [bacterium]RQV93299.1 MAG: S41 family peptidase [bacterium]